MGPFIRSGKVRLRQVIRRGSRFCLDLYPLCQMRKLIPQPVIGVLSSVIPDWTTDDSLDALFLYGGAPGEPPPVSKSAKVQKWLFETDKDLQVDPPHRARQDTGEIPRRCTLVLHFKTTSGDIDLHSRNDLCSSIQLKQKANCLRHARALGFLFSPPLRDYGRLRAAKVRVH